MKRVGSVKAVFAVAFATVLLASSFDTAWTARAPFRNASVDPSLSAGEVALLHTTAGHAGALSSKLAELGAVDIDTESAVDTVIARLSNQALAAIAADPTVTVATRDIAVSAAGGGWNNPGFENDDDNGSSTERSGVAASASASLLAIRAPLAWTRTTGRGVTVAVMDTGIADHADLPRGKVVARRDFVRDGSSLQDAGGHGTFVAGVIAANGATKGVAPDAKLVSLRVLDANGSGTFAGVARAFNWLLQNSGRYGIKVLNLSWGAPQASSYHRDILSAMTESAWFAGVTVIAAAGNAGPSAGTVTTPASDPFVIAAGSFGDQKTADRSDDAISSFSGRGPTRDGFAKPDVLAPGEHISSLRVPGVPYADRAGLQVGRASDRYVFMTGTSASAAFVSGVAALVISSRRFGPTQTKGAIVASGRPVSGTSTRAVDALDALAQTSTANAGLAPSTLLLSVLSQAGLLRVGGVTWEKRPFATQGITWETVSWESVSWETVSWEMAVTWEGVTWQRVRSE
jgi:subtilisin family serine protease